MPTPDDTTNQWKLLKTIRDRVRVQRDQQQKMGTFTPAYVVTEIEEGQREITDIKAWLVANGQTVEDVPEDGEVLTQPQATVTLPPARGQPATPSVAAPLAQNTPHPQGQSTAHRERILFWVAVIGLPLALLGTVGTYLQWWFPRSAGADVAATAPALPTANSAGLIPTVAPTAAPTAAPTPTTAPAPVFTLRYPFDVGQAETVELVGDSSLAATAATMPITDFLRLTRLEFGAIEGDSEPAWNVRVVLTNTSTGPILLDLSRRFFSLDDDQGRKADLVYFCCDTNKGELLDIGKQREIQLIFRSVDGWYGKATSAGSIYLRVTGLLPVVRQAWRFPTLATAD